MQRVLAFCQALNVGIKRPTIAEDIDDIDDEDDDDDDYDYINTLRLHRHVMTDFSDSTDTGTIYNEDVENDVNKDNLIIVGEVKDGDDEDEEISFVSLFFKTT